MNRHYVRIHLSKFGIAKRCHKAFLAPKGKRLIQKHREDFFKVLLFNGIVKLNDNIEKINFYESPFTNLYFFSPKESKGKTPLSRAHFNRQINDLLKKTLEFKELRPQSGPKIFDTAILSNYGYVKDNLKEIKYFKNCLTWNSNGSIGKVHYRLVKFSLSGLQQAKPSEDEIAI